MFSARATVRARPTARSKGARIRLARTIKLDIGTYIIAHGTTTAYILVMTFKY